MGEFFDMKLFGIFAFASVAMAQFGDYDLDALGNKKPSSAVDKGPRECNGHKLSDSMDNAKWERDDKANTRSIANLVTDGFSERANEKSPQEHVFDKFISLTGDLGHDLCTRRGFQTATSHSL